MSSTTKSLFLLTLATSLICFAGCGKKPPAAQPPAAQTESTPAPPAEAAPVEAPPAESAPAESAPAPSSEAAAPATEDQSEAKTIEASFASLSTEDRALATEQKICPVGKGLLGAMGAPIKVSVAGHEVFICCEHCQEPLLADPTTHLANIGLEPAANAAQ
jgi:hypothetical protein